MRDFIFQIKAKLQRKNNWKLEEPKNCIHKKPKKKKENGNNNFILKTLNHIIHSINMSIQCTVWPLLANHVGQRPPKSTRMGAEPAVAKSANGWTHVRFRLKKVLLLYK